MSHENQPKSGIARLLEIAGAKRNLLIIAGVLAVAHALLSIVPYALVYSIIDALLSTPMEIGLVKLYIYRSVFAAIAAYVLLYASGMVSHVAAFNILYELRRQMADKLGRLPLGFINQSNSGALKKILADDVERIENFIAHSIPDLVKGVALPVVTLGYLFTVNWQLALTSCIPIIMLAVMMPFMFGKKFKALLTEYHSSLESMNAGIVEFVRAMPVIKIFGHNAERFDKYSQVVLRFKQMVIAYNSTASPAFGIFISFISNATLPVLAVGLYLYFSQGITLSTLFLFLILGVGYIRPLFALSTLGPQISVINHGVKRLDEILFAQEQEAEGDAYLDNDFSVRFKNVSFGYQKHQYALDNVSFDVPQGTITALVGPSGSGKSTAAQLVARFWDVDSGAILIGRQNIRNVRPEELMRNIAFVFQDSFMFEQSIFENIRMGMDKTKEEVIQAAKAAQCHTFIEKMPFGYYTPWGHSGAHLSGGEQQRIQLARAILKDAPILVLDEATAFSDPENESLIQTALNKLISNKTVIVIAHRLSTITACDQIVVMRQGTIVAKGTHEELLAECPMYTGMWHAHTRAGEFALNS
ncbi:ABC transporter ATP-binding protein [Dyadobacter sp. BHUBP1]|uniref:ABC transporter ATP-binding protein n=1 Tax=Dyadobacter sp. BHUBP1 TaxID=3424178 RepID=UPI003D3399B8